jgi:superfamily I DNA and/or RNA helicase
MNVGMTRARRKLLLVGDSSTLCQHPFFVDLLAYVKRMGGYFERARGCDNLLNDSQIVPAVALEYPYLTSAKKPTDK